MISAPAAERNKEPILEVLKETLDASKQLRVLEIASGTGTLHFFSGAYFKEFFWIWMSFYSFVLFLGQHAAHFAKHFVNFLWQPTEVNTSNFKSISIYASLLPSNNVLDPIRVDVSEPIGNWSEDITKHKFDVIYCCNLIHISPYSCTTGLFQASGKLLKPGSGLLITYGPYAENGVLTPESNVRFDEGLKMQCEDWGVRDIVDLVKLAEQNGLKYLKKIDMPANNKMLFFVHS